MQKVTSLQNRIFPRYCVDFYYSISADQRESQKKKTHTKNKISKLSITSHMIQMDGGYYRIHVLKNAKGAFVTKYRVTGSVQGYSDQFTS